MDDGNTQLDPGVGNREEKDKKQWGKEGNQDFHSRWNVHIKRKPNGTSTEICFTFLLTCRAFSYKCN